jgi:hypothetical protein
MERLPEPESLATFRHRWARAIEIWVAYQAFLNREILVGQDRVCLTPLIVAQTTHTLLACYYSFVYSLFDPRGVSFERVSRELERQLPERARGVRELILEHWELMREPVAIIRNNIGFHGARRQSGMRHGYAAYQKLHPLSAEYIMTLMRVYFRLVDEVYEGAERRMRPATPDEVEALMAMAAELRSEIEATPTRDELGELSRSLDWPNGKAKPR